MITQKIPAVVCCGGHGKVLRPGKSKLGDCIHGKPVAAWMVENLKKSGAFFPVVVVVNVTLGEELVAQLHGAGHKDLLVAYQEERRGAANAAYCALDTLGMLKCGSFLTVFGEMPNIQPKTLWELHQLHCQKQPSLTFLSCPHDPSHPLSSQLSGYAHLKHGWDNGRKSEPFLRLYSKEPAERGDDILGSAYIFQKSWFEQMYPLIPAMDNKNDGFGPEYHLPWLVDLAVRRGDPYQVLRSDVPEQILGINNQSDYQVATRFFAPTNGRP